MMIDFKPVPGFRLNLRNARFAEDTRLRRGVRPLQPHQCVLATIHRSRRTSRWDRNCRSTTRAWATTFVRETRTSLEGGRFVEQGRYRRRNRNVNLSRSS